jgi:hypothetical protein
VTVAIILLCVLNGKHFVLLLTGEIEAQCSGPNTMAYCTLIDRHDGTFELKYKPQENGPHILEIKYGDECIPSLY